MHLSLSFFVGFFYGQHKKRIGFTTNSELKHPFWQGKHMEFCKSKVCGIVSFLFFLFCVTHLKSLDSNPTVDKSYYKSRSKKYGDNL
jgi:hypothetical protein